MSNNNPIPPPNWQTPLSSIHPPPQNSGNYSQFPYPNPSYLPSSAPSSTPLTLPNGPCLYPNLPLESPNPYQQPPPYNPAFEPVKLASSSTTSSIPKALQNYSFDQKDQTSTFLNLYDRVTQPGGDRELVREMGLNNYDFLLVGGLSEKNYPKYMQVHTDYLQSLGLNVHKVPVDNRASVADNSQTISDYIGAMNSGRKAVLIGHSKGGNDVLGALNMFPQLQNVVEGALTLQSPFRGSSFANDLFANSLLRKGLGLLLRKLKIDSSTLDAFSSSKTAFNQKGLADLEIPVLNLVTFASPGASTLGPFIDHSRSKYGEESDGFVSTKEASIDVPDFYSIVLEGMDHSQTMVESDVNEKGIRPKFKPKYLLFVLIVIIIGIALYKRHKIQNAHKNPQRQT